MSQSKAAARGRSGWRPEERELLWKEVEQAGREGAALRSVFDSVAAQTGRKPNSIRNYYYMSVRGGGAPDGVECQRAAPFVPFDDEELHSLVRQILRSRAEGRSVRACVMELGNGERARTLRYQNKYRSILRTRPEYIRQVMDELAAEGVVFGDDFTPVRRRRQPGRAAGLDESLSALREAAAAPGGAEALSALRGVLDALEEAAACTRS